jgi:hypothetical protein
MPIRILDLAEVSKPIASPDDVAPREGHLPLPDLPGIGFEGKSDHCSEMRAGAVRTPAPKQILPSLKQRSPA